MNARKTFVFHQDEVGIKKSTGDGTLFDIPMGAFDGVECSDLVGIYMLNILSGVREKGSYGLYRDDGLLAVKGSGPKLEQLKKTIIALFKEEGLALEEGMIASKETDFLDMVLDLNKNEYAP